MAVIGEPIKKYVAIPINEPMPAEVPSTLPALPEQSPLSPSPERVRPERKPERV